MAVGPSSSRASFRASSLQVPRYNYLDAKRDLPHLVAIVMSNHTTPQYRKASVDAGAAYFLDKSVDFERIAEILSALDKA